MLRVGAMLAARRIQRAIQPAIDRADVVHVHSNGLLAELAVLLSQRCRKPVVLTLYGTEIWHYAPKRVGPDLFTRAYHAASAVTFYSERLLGRARELGLTRRHMLTIYPPVGPQFSWHDEAARSVVRETLGIANRHLLVNVKRLHPLAGQRFLIDAMSEVIRTHPDTRLVICGTGALLGELQGAARSAGVERHVTFAGLVDNAVVARYCAAADLFVLPSILEALPTVAVEALACGTPVVSADNPGGLELNDVFGRDVSVVPREQPMPLARAIVAFLLEKRRTSHETRETIEREFRPAGVAAKYRALYDDVVSRAGA
jgi:glycosyltransferase involved in cell wall biosynthesis